MRWSTITGFTVSSDLENGPQTGMSELPCEAKDEPWRRSFMTRSMGNLPLFCELPIPAGEF